MKKTNNNLLHLINNCCSYGNNKNDFHDFDLYVKTMENTQVMLDKLTLLNIDWCFDCLDLYVNERKLYVHEVLGRKYYKLEVEENWHSYLKATIEQDMI